MDRRESRVSSSGNGLGLWVTGCVLWVRRYEIRSMVRVRVRVRVRVGPTTGIWPTTIIPYEYRIGPHFVNVCVGFSIVNPT